MVEHASGTREQQIYARRPFGGLLIACQVNPGLAVACTGQHPGDAPDAGPASPVDVSAALDPPVAAPGKPVDRSADAEPPAPPLMPPVPGMPVASALLTAVGITGASGDCGKLPIIHASGLAMLCCAVVSTRPWYACDRGWAERLIIKRANSMVWPGKYGSGSLRYGGLGRQQCL